MELKLFEYIIGLLKKAHYEYDPSVRAWAAWIKGFPGIYAQAGNVEEARADLISALEDYLLLELQEGKRIQGLKVSARHYAKAH